MKRFLIFKSPALVLLFSLCVLPPFSNDSFAQGNKAKQSKQEIATASLSADSQLGKPGEEIPIHLLIKPKVDAVELVKHTGFGPKEWLGCRIRVVDKKGNEMPLLLGAGYSEHIGELFPITVDGEQIHDVQNNLIGVVTRLGKHLKKAFEFWGPVEGSVQIGGFHLTKDSFITPSRLF